MLYLTTDTTIAVLNHWHEVLTKRGGAGPRYPLERVVWGPPNPPNDAQRLLTGCSRVRRKPWLKSIVAFSMQLQYGIFGIRGAPAEFIKRFLVAAAGAYLAAGAGADPPFPQGLVCPNPQ